MGSSVRVQLCQEQTSKQPTHEFKKTGSASCSQLASLLALLLVLLLLLQVQAICRLAGAPQCADGSSPVGVCPAPAGEAVTCQGGGTWHLAFHAFL